MYVDTIKSYRVVVCLLDLTIVDTFDNKKKPALLR